MTTKRASTTSKRTPSTAPPASAKARSRTPRRASGHIVQLPLVDDGSAVRRSWALDARTRRVGREGVAQARDILRRAREEREQVAS